MGLCTTREAQYAREREQDRHSAPDAPPSAEELEQDRIMAAYLALSASERHAKRANARAALEYPLDKRR